MKLRNRILPMAVLLLLTALSCDRRESGEKEWKHLLGSLPAMFVGTIPCADCPGIETHLTLLPDSTAALSSLYLDREQSPFVSAGRWRMSQGMLIATFEGSQMRLLAKSDSTVAMVGPDGRESPSLASAYILTRRRPLTASFFGGEYLLVADAAASSDTLSQQLTIRELTPERVQVTVGAAGVAPASASGCRFTARGTVVNDQIQVELHPIDTQYRSTLLIRTEGDDMVRVSVAAGGGSDELARLCNGNGTLEGRYRKVMIR